MFDAIQYVTGGLTLVAFVVAVGASISYHGIRRKERLVRSAQGKQRLEILEVVLEGFRVDTADLTADQKFSLLREQMQSRERKSHETLKFASIALVVLSTATVIILLSPGTIAKRPVPTSTVVNSSTNSRPMDFLPHMTNTAQRSEEELLAEERRKAEQAQLAADRKKINEGEAKRKDLEAKELRERAELEKTVQKFMKDVLALASEPRGDERLVEDLKYDAFDIHIVLTSELEEKFGVDISGEQADAFIRVRDIVNFLYDKGVRAGYRKAP